MIPLFTSGFKLNSSQKGGETLMKIITVFLLAIFVFAGVVIAAPKAEAKVKSGEEQKVIVCEHFTYNGQQYQASIYISASDAANLVNSDPNFTYGVCAPILPQ